MRSLPIPEAFRSAQSAGFLKVPLPVPPMIEQAFRYRGEERYVALGFGIHGGVMNDSVGDAIRPKSRDLYRSFLLHPAIKPYADAFQIEMEPPSWLEGMEIEELGSHQEQIESWWNTSRCLLLDRKERLFFVGTVSKIGNWLILRGTLSTDRGKVGIGPRAHSSKLAEQALTAWLAAQSVPLLPQECLEAWERQFRDRLAIEGCMAAAFRLGFEAGDVRSMMAQAFGRGSEL